MRKLNCIQITFETQLFNRLIVLWTAQFVLRKKRKKTLTWTSLAKLIVEEESKKIEGNETGTLESSRRAFSRRSGLLSSSTKCSAEAMLAHTGPSSPVYSSQRGFESLLETSKSSGSGGGVSNGVISALPLACHATRASQPASQTPPRSLKMLPFLRSVCGLFFPPRHPTLLLVILLFLKKIITKKRK